MNTVSVELSLDQLKQALRRLPPGEKMALWRLLDEDIDRAAIARRFEASLKTIRKAYASTSEDIVMADAVKATRAVRHAKSRS
jgi:DNA-directed RNA polymerase specialized sigma24 family protein